ncbi:MAG: hypothetical protein M0R05_05440 [Bacilli bacterium]|nr:hypothetical protein [Bacilli bacterium]MDD4077000.1 hypothetical protein [Bacilli bacterium]MDD4387945.1 hypothetical protein [Bacilli bacterium]
MNEERMKVLEMLSQGIITVDEANELLKSLDSSKVVVDRKLISEAKHLKNTAGKFLYIKVISKDGDKINVNLPIALLKSAMKLGNVQAIIDKSLSGSSIADEMIDVDLIIQCIENGVIGDIVSVESSDGDVVRIYIE